MGLAADEGDRAVPSRPRSTWRRRHRPDGRYPDNDERGLGRRLGPTGLLPPRSVRRGPSRHVLRPGTELGLPDLQLEVLERRGFDFWAERLAEAEKYYSCYRIDHVLGFFRIWALSERESTGALGRFIPDIPVTRAELESSGSPRIGSAGSPVRMCPRGVWSRRPASPPREAPPRLSWRGLGRRSCSYSKIPSWREGHRGPALHLARRPRLPPGRVEGQSAIRIRSRKLRAYTNHDSVDLLGDSLSGRARQARVAFRIEEGPGGGALGEDGEIPLGCDRRNRA